METYTFTSVNLAGAAVYAATVGQEVQFRGIRSTNGNLTVAVNAALGTVDLTLSDLTLVGTKVFANAAARALTAPDFQGQFGTQLDTGAPYISTGTNAGDWSTYPWLILGATSTSAADATTTFSLAGGTGISTLSLAGSGGTEGRVTFDNLALVKFDSVGDVQFAAGTTATIQTGAILDFENGSEVQLSSNPIPADSLVATSGSPGGLTSRPINAFVSIDNTASYTQPSGTASRAGFATYVSPVISNPPTQAEVQALSDSYQEASEHLKALLDDLASTLKPEY